LVVRQSSEAVKVRLQLELSESAAGQLNVAAPPQHLMPSLRTNR
jgi:hypothetical protein